LPAYAVCQTRIKGAGNNFPAPIFITGRAVIQHGGGAVRIGKFARMGAFYLIEKIFHFNFGIKVTQAFKYYFSNAAEY
jgi:hypothetical protein